MAWTYGNIQWTFPFKSLNGTACHIDVYKRGYTGSFVYTLKAAADPFFFEEDNDSDILNNVLRYRTGYIKVIEEYSNGWLSEIYPTAAFDRYVEVYYGDTMIFNGYIQLQDFSNDQVPAPRVLELPVISPLGLYDQKTFNAIQPPTSKTLGELLDIALSSDYQYMYMPKNAGYPNTVGMAMKISSLVVSPWNEDYHHSMNVAAYDKVMTGESYAFLIEAICKAFGWIAHDTPGSLVFTSFDYEDTYCYFPVGHIGATGYSTDADISASAVDLATYFENADDNANVLTLLPDTGIKIEYEGDDNIGSHIFDFKRTFVPEQNPVVVEPSAEPIYDSPNAEVFSLCNLTPVAFIQEISNTSSLSFNNNDKIVPTVGCCAWNGKVGVMISFSSWSTNTNLFWVRFYIKKRAGQYFGVTYDMIGKQSGSIGQLANQQSDVDDYYITTSVTSTDDYVQVQFSYRWSDPSYPQLPTYALVFISNIKLEVWENGLPYAQYRYMPASDADVIPSTGRPAISSSLTMPISLYRLNDRLIGTNPRSTKVTEYPYLFQQRKQYVGKFRVTSLPTFPHVRLYSYIGKNWRIIAQRFAPWDDEMKLTLQYSPIL